MTFVVGFECHDGLVLCAESLEEDGYIKRIVPKLRSRVVNGEWGIAFGCSGTSPGINKFSDKLGELIGTGKYDRYATENTIEATLKYMQQQHPQQQLELIIGLWAQKETHLYPDYQNSHCMSVGGGFGFVCCGMDLSLGDVILDGIFDEAMGVEEAAKMGIFATAVVKAKVDGCGWPTRS